MCLARSSATSDRLHAIERRDHSALSRTARATKSWLTQSSKSDADVLSPRKAFAKSKATRPAGVSPSAHLAGTS